MNIPEEMLTTVDAIYQLPKAEGDFGVEIELEGRRITDLEVRGWTTHKENSLRGEGVEFVTKGAVSEKKLAVIVKELNRVLTGGDRQIIPSNRTSTHIHLNMQDAPLIDVLGYLVVYTLVEPLMFRLYAPGRDGNLFCQSSYDTGDAARALHQALKGPLENAFFEFREKYASLNILPITKFGSVECRIFPSSIDVDEILTWCRTLKNIKEAVRKSDKDFFRIVNDARTNPDVFIEELFGVEATPERKELIQFGSEQAYEMARVIRRYLQDPNKDAIPFKEVYTQREMEKFMRDGIARSRKGYPGIYQWIGKNCYKMQMGDEWVHYIIPRRI